MPLESLLEAQLETPLQILSESLSDILISETVFNGNPIVEYY